MRIKIKNIAYLLILFAGVNVSAAILGKDEAEQADLSLLMDETVLFQSIGMSIALSIAQCDGVDLCSFTVEEAEIQELINTLDTRIEGMVLKQEEAEDPVGFDKVLTAYIDQRENYTTHLEKLKKITDTLGVDSDLLDDLLESEEMDFSVESAKNEELVDYLNVLDAFADDELEDDEDLDDLSDFPELEDINSNP